MNREKIVHETPHNLVDYRNRVGQTYFFVITGKTGRNIWGTNIYTDDSNLAVAAVHAGAIKNGETKVISVEIVSGQLTYQGSRQNGIVSSSYSAWAGSYLFTDFTGTSEKTVQNLSTYRQNVGNVFSFVITGSTEGSVCGTDIYTDDSNLPVAAVHAGIVNAGETKIVTVKILPGHTSYQGTHQNGVLSLPYGFWKGSYSFVKNTANVNSLPVDFAANESKLIKHSLLS